MKTARQKRLSLILGTVLLIFSVPFHLSADVGITPGATETPVEQEPLAELNRAIDTDPGNVNARLARAQWFEETDRPDAAMADYQWLMTNRPDLPHAYNGAARLLASRGDLERAIDVLERGIETDAVYATMFSNLRRIFASLASRAYETALNEPQSGEDLDRLDAPLALELRRLPPDEGQNGFGGIAAKRGTVIFVGTKRASS